MEESNFEDVCVSSVKKEPEDILSLPEVIVCPENQIMDEEEWVICSSGQLCTDPLATNSVCEMGKEESMSIIDSSPKTESFTTEPLERDIASECKSGRVDPSNSMVLSEELDLGVSQLDEESGGNLPKMEVPHTSVNEISLPPVHADPDPEQTRRLLDNALQKIISQVTKRKGRKRRASQPLNDEMKQENKFAPECSSLLSAQQINNGLLSSPKDLIDPILSIPRTTPVNSRAIPNNDTNTPENTKFTPTSEVLQSKLMELSSFFPPAIELPTVNQVDIVLNHDKNFSRPLVKKPRKSTKLLPQQLQSKKQTSPISTGSRSVLTTNLSPSSVPVISERHSNNGFGKNPFRATGGDPCPAGGSPAAAGANAMAEGAQEAGDGRTLRTPLARQLKMRNISKEVLREARPQLCVDTDNIHKDVAINFGKEKQIVAPSSHSAQSQRKQNFSRQTMCNRPTPVCNLCGRGFSTYCELMSHLRLHTASVRRFFCSSCKSRFGHAQALASHVRKRHGIEVPVLSAGGWQRPFAYSCNSCDKFYELRASLHKHLLVKHCPVRSKVVNGVATALMGMTRMRGAIPKEYNPVPRSSALKRMPFLDNQSHALSNSEVNSEEEKEMNSNSCSKASHPSSVPPFGRKHSLSHSSVSRMDTLLPTSMKTGPLSPGTSSTSSSSMKSSSKTSLIDILEYDQGYFLQTPEMRRSKTISPSPCPVHPKVTSNTNIKSVKNSKCVKKKQQTSKSSVTKKANYSHQVIKDQPHPSSKIFHSRNEVPCPVHKSSHETVKDFVHNSCSKKINFTQASRTTSLSIGKPVPESVISLISEENVVSPSPPASDSEFVGSSVTSVTSIFKSRVSKAVNRSVSQLSTSIHKIPTGHEISKNLKKIRHSFPSHSSCLTSTIPKLQKIQTISAGNISLCDTNPAHNKMSRPPGNSFVSPLSNTHNRTTYNASSKPTNKKRNSFPPYAFSPITDPKSQKIHTSVKKSSNCSILGSNSFPPYAFSPITDPKSQKIHTSVKKSSNCSILGSKNTQRSSFSHNSTAVVNVKNIKGLPKFNSSTSSTQDVQPYVVLNDISQSSSYDSYVRVNSKNKVNRTPILPTCGNPVVLLKRIDHLLLKKSQ